MDESTELITIPEFKKSNQKYGQLEEDLFGNDE